MFLKKLYRAVFGSKSRYYSIVTAAAVILSIIQLGVIVYLNFFRIKYHIDADASIDYLRFLEQASPLYPGGFVTATTGTGMGLFTFLNKFKLMLCGGDVFLYFAIRNTLITFTCVILVVQIMRKLNTSALAGILVINLFLCPYITLNIQPSNELGYFSCMFVSAGYYGKRIIIELLLIYNMFDLMKKHFNWPLLIVGAIYMIDFGLTTGVAEFLNILAPLIIFFVCYSFIKNDAKLLISHPSVYILICTFLIFAAKIFAKKVLNVSAYDDSVTFVAAKDLLTNIFSVFVGFAALIGATTTKESVEVFSFYGVQYLINFVILAVFAISFIYYIYKLVKKSPSAIKHLPFFVVFVTVFAVHCLVAPTFEHETVVRAGRYLIPAMISGLFLISFFTDDIAENGLMRKFGVLVLAGAAAISSFSSYKVYEDRAFPYNAAKRLIEKIDETDVPVVYGFGNTYSYGVCTTSNSANYFRVLDHTRAYRALHNNYNYISLIGDYLYFNDASECASSSMIMSTAGDYESLPSYIANKYELIYLEPELGIGLYYSEKNPFDLTSAIEPGKNTEYMYSQGISIGCGYIDEDGYLVSDGNEGVLMTGSPIHGQSIHTQKGVYDITLCYEVMGYADENEAVLSVCSGEDKELASQAVMSKDKTSITIENVEITSDGYEIGYFVTVPQGAQVKLRSIDINLKS